MENLLKIRKVATFVSPVNKRRHSNGRGSSPKDLSRESFVTSFFCCSLGPELFPLSSPRLASAKQANYSVLLVLCINMQSVRESMG